jgi:nitrate reductase alpha subunit
VQASDCDLNDLRSTKLQVLIGKNLIENKRADNHYFSEGMERGAKIYVVTPEYSPSGTKADVWIPIRPNSDTAFLLGVTRLMIDKGWYDKDFVQKFTDFPLLVRSDTLERMQAKDLFEGYTNQDLSEGPSYKIQGLTDEQREIIGDFVVYNEATSDFAAVTREDIGDTLAQKGITPAIDGRWDVTLVSGETVEVFTLFAGYKVHLEDYDLDSVVEITESPRELIEQLAYDFYTIKPAAIHEGEGINHWFHATEVNRATYLPLILTGNIGQRGAGSHTWAGNYKAGLFQASPRTGPGFKGWVGEDPFDMNLDPEADGKDIKAHGHTMGEEPAFWNYSERALVVDTPDAGRKAFTGHTHMPSPTKAMWFCNVNIINNAKWAYEMVKNVDPHVEMIMGTDIEFNGTIEFSDIGLPATSWAETEQPEITAACSNPFLQIWKGGIKPVYDSRDDVVILAQMAAKIGELTGDDRYAKYWKFALEGRTDVYIQRLLDASTTTRGYEYDDVMAGKYGEPGAALMMFRTYPRVPFYEQIHDSEPFHTRTGRLQAYNDEPECIEYGENFIVHREGPEATPYLPNVIISSNPNVRPESYGIPLDHMGADERQVRNVKMPWREVKRTENPLWKAGYQFYCLTPKTRHATHSSWQVVDWHLIWNNQFGDPYRVDKRSPGVGEHTLHVNPQAGKDQGINDGDYVYVDANPADRPYAGWKPNDPFYKVARLMLRVKYNPAYPYNIIMMKHGPWMATDRTVKAHETRKDGRAVAEGTGYQSSFRYGSQQSITRGWLMPMHTTDTLFHKAKAKMGFIFGGEADNHAINTVPKETLVRMTKAEDGGLGGRGVWQPATKGMSPDAENELMQAYMRGEFIEEG